MTKYLLIETQDPFENAVARDLPAVVEGFLARGHEVTLYLIQNAVLGLRKGSSCEALFGHLRQKKVTLLADGFSLRERAIGATVDGVTAIEMKDFIPLLFTDGTKVIWH